MELMNPMSWEIPAAAHRDGSWVHEAGGYTSRSTIACPRGAAYTRYTATSSPLHPRAATTVRDRLGGGAVPDVLVHDRGADLSEAGLIGGSRHH